MKSRHQEWMEYLGDKSESEANAELQRQVYLDTVANLPHNSYQVATNPKKHGEVVDGLLYAILTNPGEPGMVVGDGDLPFSFQSRIVLSPSIVMRPRLWTRSGAT